MTMEQYLDNEKQTVDEFEAELEKRVRDAMASQFLLDEVAKAEEIGVEQDELTGHLMRRAQQSGQNPDEFMKHMVEHNHIPEMVAEVVRGKALARIVEGATVTDESGNAVDLKNLRPDGSIGDPRRRRPAAHPGRRGRGRRRSPSTRRPTRPRSPTRRATRRPDRRGSLTRAVSFSEHLFTVRRNDASTLDAAALAADYAEDLVLGTVREVHGAVAGRIHGINDRINGGGPTVGHRLHDGISKAVYGGIRVGFRAGSTGPARREPGRPRRRHGGDAHAVASSGPRSTA